LESESGNLKEKVKSESDREAWQQTGQGLTLCAYIYGWFLQNLNIFLFFEWKDYK